MKLWTGRFKKEVDAGVNDFNSSIPFDQRLIHEDITGSIAHATMLGECGIISSEDAKAILEELPRILSDVESGTLPIDPTAEDVHTFVEAELTKRIGDAGKRLHTARSRNDQVALDLRLWTMHELSELKELICEMITTLCNLAKEHTETIMPGYTHLQRAQPITFAHHLMAYAEMLLRDLGRLQDAGTRMSENPLGCGALAGTTYPLNRDRTTELLGFDRTCQNSLDGVSDRDYTIEIASALSILMMHLSRFSEEIILWCSWEFKFIELDDAFATGSSIMPQKKNPDVAELVRGKTGRVYGDLITLLTMMKGIPLAYDKDIQEDKEALFDAVDTAKICLKTFTPMLASMTVLRDNMRAAAAKGFINATDCADYLVGKGLPFRDAYKAVGEIVARCIEGGKTLETLLLSDYQAVCDLFGEDVYEAISLERCTQGRKVTGGPAKETVERHIQSVLEKLSNSHTR